MSLKAQSFFSNYLERLENLQKGIDEVLQGLPQAALDWTPGPDMNSLAVMLAHIGGSLRYWIGDVALEEPSDRVRAREFQTHDLEADELRQRLEAALDFTRANLPRLSLADLDRPRRLEAGQETVTCGWALLHALEHGYLHLGHLQITRQLWEIQAGLHPQPPGES